MKENQPKVNCKHFNRQNILTKQSVLSKHFHWNSNNQNIQVSFSPKAQVCKIIFLLSVKINIIGKQKLSPVKEKSNRKMLIL